MTAALLVECLLAYLKGVFRRSVAHCSRTEMTY